MRKLILVVGLTLVSMHPISMPLTPADPPARRSTVVPFRVGQLQRNRLLYQWDRRDSPPPSRIPTRK